MNLWRSLMGWRAQSDSPTLSEFRKLVNSQLHVEHPLRFRHSKWPFRHCYASQQFPQSQGNMQRFQLFEIEDQAWFPKQLHNYMTDFLRTVAEQFNLFEPVVPVLRDILAETGKKRIVDLASGGDGQ
ncbi:MAG: hypothetical protein R3C09_08755 [Pirellulaceae bacterium]|jgi:hypothetical protein